jgi:hypothetical protein
MFTTNAIRRMSQVQRMAFFARLRSRSVVAEVVGTADTLRRADAVLGRFALLSGMQ